MAVPTPSSGLSLTLRVSQVLQKPWWTGPEDTYIVDVHSHTSTSHTHSWDTSICKGTDRHANTAYTPTFTDPKKLQKQS